MTTGRATLAASDFVHLHNHTNHSLLDGLTKVPELISLIKDFGMDAVAMTDHGTLSGWIDFYKTATAAGIKPIFGLEAYVAARKHTDRDPAKDKERFHLTILAMNKTGYDNLMHLSTIANLDGYYYKPRIDHDLLEKYGEGLIILSGCGSGEIGEKLRNGDYKGARDTAKWYKSVFGDRYYMELQDHGHPDAPKHWEIQRQINDGALKIAKELNIEAVVTCDAHYAKADDVDAHEILLCVGTGSFLSDPKRMSLSDFQLHVTDPREIIKRWGKEHPELIHNTKKIADRCQVELDLGGILIPTFPVPDGETEKSYLEKLVYRGLAWRYGGVTEAKSAKMTVAAAKKAISPEILERVKYEMSVIEKMGFDGYFLIVWDFINWGKNNGIVFGPGRGSAAGSIVSYALKITELNPLQFELLFERFLNPDRISMPDIDIDIQDTRRDEVIKYCSEKYGADRVANITTFGTMAARAAVKDVARVLEVPYTESDRLSKLIPPPIQGRHVPLAQSIKTDQDLKREYDTNPTSRRVIDFAIRLEGTIRSHGVHAAGVVIAPDELVKFAPLEMAQKGVVATQFPMGPIEDLGLLKMDFLGLSNLTIIHQAMRIVRKVYGRDIDLSTLPMDDEKTYKLFQNGETTGVFQFESAGMKRYLRELKPSTFDDIVAMVALYRPGPMQFIDSFIKRKHGEEQITYLHPKMENALSPTYGILVYQEQFMQIAKDLSGFTGGQADYLRKAVGKKKMDMMLKIKPEFIDGALKNNPDITRDTMEQFWSQLEEFANYCFNKSHAACYGLIAYWTAYLKAHYPSAFMAALMTSDAGNIDRLAIDIGECQHMGVKVMNPDINESFLEFAVVPETNHIRFGLAAVKGVGEAVVEEILRAREDGKFASIEDFARRVSSRVINRRVWESLVKSGAFDSFGERSDILFNLETIMAFASKIQKEAASGQVDLFGALIDAGGEAAEAVPSINVVTAPEKHSGKEMLAWERELLGLYLSSHPLDKYDTYFAEQTVPSNILSSDMDGARTTVGGIVTTMRTIVTKAGSKMAFVGFEDKHGESEIVVFPKLLEDMSDRLAVDVVIKAEGRVSGTDRDGNRVPDPKMIADTITIITDAELNSYQSTGQKLDLPQASEAKAKRPTKATTTAQSIDTGMVIVSVEDFVLDDESAPRAELSTVRKLYVHVKDPSDSDRLLTMKQKLSEHSGDDEVILVLGPDKKDAIRLPFKTNAHDDLVCAIGEIYGAECVVVK